ncbi:uncharacterized protein [Procambarus clarkii]|uniref:uncharacterized protein isoform X2 n=1 Tax=Procambarus clarkii TaxID=6728 RepID=UPI0037431B7F
MFSLLTPAHLTQDSKVVWTPNLVRQVKRAFRIVRRDEDGRNCVRRGKRPPLLLTLCSTIDLCTPNTSNCRRTGWRGRQTPIAPTLSAHNLLNFPAPSQLKLRFQLKTSKARKTSRVPRTTTTC